LQDKIKIKKEIDKVEINFKKVKWHSEIEENKKADRRVKKGLEEETTYIQEEDLEKYKNKISIFFEEREIHSNYRKELKKYTIMK
jgi:ribonuclease HI